MKRALALALLGAACHRTVGPAGPTEAPVLLVEAPEDERAGGLQSGDLWSGGGLCLVLPEAWSGGVPEGGAQATLHHTPSGVTVSVFVLEGREPTDVLRPGYTLTFEDNSAYRKLAVFEDGGTRTWTSDAPGGPTLKAWYGTVATQCFMLEFLLPFGRAIEGTHAVEELLTAISTSC
jgi:hypothetical protein